MLPKKKRLNLRIKSNKEIFSAPCFYTKSFKFYYRSAEEFRAAVVIPVKIERMAARRNLLRRQVYQAIELNDIVQQPIEILVMASRKELGNFDQINQEIISGLKQIKSVNKK
jgi:ribonuclease P protein component